MSHFTLCTKGVQVERQLSCIPIVKVLLQLFENTGLSDYIHAKVHGIKFYEQDFKCTVKELASENIQ